MKYAILLLLGLAGCNEITSPPNIVVVGKIANVSFCEGDDGTISIQNERLKIDCADRHKIPITVNGPGVRQIGSMNIDCDEWCRYGVNIEQAKGLTVTNMTISNTGFSLQEQK